MKRSNPILFFLPVLVIAVLGFYGCQPKAKQSLHPELQEGPIPKGLGVNIHFYKGNEKDYSMIDNAGIDIVRMDVLWATIEKQPGVYDFSKQDQLVKDLKAHHKRLLFIICYGNPLYDIGQAPHTDEGRAASARFCKAMATHFSGQHIIWELWNEPNSDHFWSPKANVSDYVKWCKAVVPAIRKADPGACIIGPAVSAIDIPYLEKAFEHGLLNLVDGVSVHPYRNPNRGPETTYDEYENLKVLIDLYKPAGKTIPIISGEWGYSTYFVSPEVQGKYLARQWLNNLASGVPISIWYDWHDDGQDPKNAEHNFGTVTFDYKPKPAYIAMKTLISQLRGYHFIERLATPSEDDYEFLFSNEKQFKIALWTTGAPHSFAPKDWTPKQAVNHLGETVSPENENHLTLTDGPLYCTISGAVPAYFDLLEKSISVSPKESLEAAADLAGTSHNKNGFANSLQKYLKDGTTAEKNAAWLIISRLAKNTEQQPETALNLYKMILNSSAPARAKQEALYRIAVIGSEKSEPIVESFLHQPEYAKAASVYYMQMAYKYATEKDFKRALNSVFKGTKVTGLRYGADRALQKMKEMGWREKLKPDEIARENGFIRHWNLAGPFPNEGNADKQPAYFPEKGYKPEQTEQFPEWTAKWQTATVDNIWGIVPLAEMYGKKRGSVYAYREIEVENDTDALFKLGSNDGEVCWVNGEKVHTNIVDRALTVDEDVFPVHLKKGKNIILLKILNSGGNWEFCLRVCNKNGLPLKIQEN